LLLDTGSNINLVSEKLLSPSEIQLAKFPIKITGINPTPLHSRHESELTISLGYLLFDITAYVLPNLAIPCLLGLTAMRNLQLNIDFNSNTVTFPGNHIVPISKDASSTASVYMNSIIVYPSHDDIQIEQSQAYVNIDPNQPETQTDPVANDSIEIEQVSLSENETPPQQIATNETSVTTDEISEVIMEQSNNVACLTTLSDPTISTLVAITQ